MPYIGVSPQFGVRKKHTYTATAGQTSFSGAGSEGATLTYKDSNFVDVYQNGVKLGDADYTSTSGTAIVLAQGASVDDLVEIIVFDAFSAADTVSKADGGSFEGAVTLAGGVSGVLTANDGIKVDDITIDGTEIDLSSGNLTIDVDGQLIVNSDSGQVVLQDDTVNWGNLQNSSGDFVIGSLGADKDIIFQGLDGSSTIEAMRIDVSEGGKIGIGTNSPSEKLEINTGTGNIGAKIVSTDSLALLAYKDNSTSDVVLSGASGDNFAVSHDILFTNASKGIYLGVTSATASNLLDDYEEGTWTPTVGGWTSVTYSYRAASYVKIGHMCHVNCSLRFSGTSAGSTVQINGLPFLQELNANGYGSGTGAIGYQTLSTVTNHTVSTVYVVQGTTRVQLYTMGGSAVNASGNASDLWFEFSAVYPTQ